METLSRLRIIKNIRKISHSFDLEVTPEEIAKAYKKINPHVVDCLKKAAENIIKFHRAQLEREMWSIEVTKGHTGWPHHKAHGYCGLLYPWRKGSLPQFHI